VSQLLVRAHRRAAAVLARVALPFVRADGAAPAVDASRASSAVFAHRSPDALCARVLDDVVLAEGAAAARFAELAPPAVFAPGALDALGPRVDAVDARADDRRSAFRGSRRRRRRRRRRREGSVLAVHRGRRLRRLLHGSARGDLQTLLPNRPHGARGVWSASARPREFDF